MARSSSALIHVSSRSAQAVITRAESPGRRVTVKRPERSVRLSERDKWKRSSGRIARLRGSTQNSSAASRLSAIGKMPVA